MADSYHHGDLREALLAAAETILERDGIQALTLRAAARAVGVSHAAPAHHFGDLTGLLSDLAAVGFDRFRARMEAEIAAACPVDRILAAGRGYVAFARASPGLFLLMFRSERLDWSRPALLEAGDRAFASLAEADANAALPEGMPRLAAITAQWALVHGLSMLLIDGRLRPVCEGQDTDTLIEAVLQTFAARLGGPAEPV